MSDDILKTLFGRNQLTARILNRVDQEFRLDQLSGAPGSGKTMLLHHLQRVLSSHTEEPPGDRPHAILIDLSLYDPGVPDESENSLGAAQSSFIQLEALLAELVRTGCPEGAHQTFAEAVADARNSKVARARIVSLADSMRAQHEAPTVSDLVRAYDAAASAVSSAFARTWNVTADQTRWLLIDDLDLVGTQPLGRYLGQLVPRLSNTRVVAAHEPGAAQIWDDDHVIDHSLANFDEVTVRRWVEATCDRPVTNEMLAAIQDVSRGHPLTLALVGLVLWRTGSDRRADSGLLSDLAPNPSDRCAALVGRYLDELSDDLVRYAVWAAAVPRHFDFHLFEHLLTSELETAASPEAVRKVYQLVTSLPFIGPAPSLMGERFEMHLLVRQGLFRELRTPVRLAQFTRLNTAVARFYEAKVTDEEGDTVDDAFEYLQGFKTSENPDWQSVKREWLYHRGLAAGRAEKIEALREIVRVFLDAFWWWGCYVRHDFCDQLVADLTHLINRRAARGQVEDWSELEDTRDALRSVLQNYPLGLGKPMDADWDEVRDALEMLGDVCDLRLGNEPPDGLTGHLAALLCLFLAQTYRFQRPHDERAETFYLKAIKSLEPDSWILPWIAFERAELRLQRKDYDAVEALWRSGAELAQPVSPGEVTAVDDEEVVSELHRVRADFCRAVGAETRAAHWYGRAVLHAYRFHVVGRPPDEYTTQWHIDMQARALNLVRHVWSTNRRELALDCAVAMVAHKPPDPWLRDEVAALLEADDLQGVGRLLFPREPSVLELTTSQKTPFRVEFRAIMRDLDMDLFNTDLHDPVWP